MKNIEDLINEYGFIEFIYDNEANTDAYDPKAVKGLWTEDDEND